MNAHSDPLAVRRRLEDRYRRLAEMRQLRLVAAVIARFTEIDGGTLGAVVSVQLFTTVIPLMILGFSYLTGFADNASPGTAVSRQLGLVSPMTEHVRAVFGRASGLRSSWTFLGVAGFLVWGIPMSMTIAGIFAKAWRREQLDWVAKLGRGVLWFALYLVMMIVRERIAFGGHHHMGLRTLRFVASLVPVWIFWTATPALLVRDGFRGRRYLVLAGLAGVVIDGTVVPLAARMFFPRLLEGWDEFGPIGIAMALLTWCGVIGTGWVVTACVGAVLWERNAPAQTVIESETAEEAAAS
ncbi:hypothetical protein [Mycolicibacterium fluoranthenivorans]|uniref:Uncharacterized BrkB/YihY/UPF0761 family membrane protein n=1 Tax=Mycolicibacterium fluoranthenivorans TaxID=258505 RepID=A0A7X5U235_9MYCO|nr:hypothetical protein [Mycolicibacterium fluoranthenivorans]MCV7354460.1 hypothetical protein [Mycolicibacterium fluoranthenivorans]NIH96965.1 uncharacterized BrkB/YihY/UPF0761 family membrane protein [Mycolicibacterium fluoranthenivorans]